MTLGIIFGAVYGGYGIFCLIMGTNMPLVVVTSESMEPTIYRGDLLVIMHKDPALIKNGTGQGDPEADIIVYDSHGVWDYPEEEPIVHRVVGKKYENGTWWFLAQGDNAYTNPHPDPPGGEPWPKWIPADKVIGVVVLIVPKVGYLKLWLTETGLGIPLLIIIGFLLMISIVYDLTHPEEERDKKEEEEKIGDLKDTGKKGENGGDYSYGDVTP